MITLATLPKASLQDIFTQARDHLLKQNCKSQRKHPHSGGTNLVCAYRGNNNTMCAVGCFIADEEYKPKMDTGVNTSFDSLIATGIFPIMNDKHCYLLAKLQLIHDQYEPNQWSEKLLDLAIAFDLEWV